MLPKFWTYLSALVAATLLLIFLNVNGWLKPISSSAVVVIRPFVYVGRGIGNGTKDFFGFFRSVAQLNRQNADLASQVRNLQEQNVALQQYKLENDVLQKELDYRHSTNLDLVSAVVIARDPSGFSQTVTINSGVNQGIKPGDAVLAQGILIGKVISADQFTARVLLITDSQSKIDAELSDTGQTGVLQGSFGSGVVLGDISQNVALKSGEMVATAGLTDQIPKGILIGTIGALQSNKQDLLQTATVIPGVDLKSLEFVAVVRSGQ